jgi:tetratricopeptide (TPR) repeat protein
LLDAVQIEHARGEFDVAMQYANNALTLLGENVGYREATLLRDHTLGRMYFSIGALYAVGRNDHAEAVHFYLQALPLLDQPLPPELTEDRGRHGERMVSMGVSFWQNGNKPQAIELTLKGARLVQAAVEARELDTAALAVPYGNLAAMYHQLGNSSEAEKYGDLAKKIEPVKTSRR